jgi:hypothetical protein
MPRSFLEILVPNFCVFIILITRATCPVHISLLDMIALIMSE